VDWKRFLLRAAISLVIVSVLLMVWNALGFFGSGGSSTQEGSLKDLVEQVRAGQVSTIEVDDTDGTYTLKNGEEFTFEKEKGATVREILYDAGVSIEDQPPIINKKPSFFSKLFGNLLRFLPIIFIVAILFFFMRQAQGANKQAMNFGKSRHNHPTQTNVTFLDVAGADEAKEELQEIVEFLKVPERFIALGARIPRGVLLVGPPGCGKTLLAKAVAGEAKVPFLSISGSDFVEMFVGVGASRVRDLFADAKKSAPCIIFIDEIDAVGRHRGAGIGGSHDEREQTLNQILVEMDGFDTQTNIIMIAATNRPDILDPALLRPGRFDRQVILDRPDIKGRKEILQIHAKGKPLAKKVSLGTVAKQTPGFTGADLANLVNEAAILAARRGKKRVGMAEFDEAVDRVIAGPERKSRVISPQERKIIAHHEAGHALVGHLLLHADPPYKISIIQRGMAGGFTRFLSEEDRHLFTRSQFEDKIAVMLGGLVAEKMFLGETTTGPQDDLDRATKIARDMIIRYGMSEHLGPRTFGRKEEMVFLGREISEQRNYSEKVAEEIDDEVRAIIDKAYQKAKQVLTDNKPRLDQVVAVLLQKETIEGKALQNLLKSPVDVGEDSQETS